MLKCTFELSEQLNMMIDNKGSFFYAKYTNLNSLHIAHPNVITGVTGRIHVV